MIVKEDSSTTGGEDISVCKKKFQHSQRWKQCKWNIEVALIKWVAWIRQMVRIEQMCT
jgi:hypothetical protein